MYRTLHAERILPLVATLCMRVEERFPTRGLVGVCHEFYQVAQDTQERIRWIAKPNKWLRVIIAVLIVALLGLVGSALLSLDLSNLEMSFVELLAVVEAGVNDVIFIGAAIFFLVSIENRIKRARALEGLGQLRVLAHIIDMHQLTKDPNRLSSGKQLQGPDTASSPKRELNAFELTRYLDYCSEMLSLIGKIAALYAQAFDDPVVLSAVNEIEALSTGLSRKIWQKIMIIHSLETEAALSAQPVARDSMFASE